MNRLTRHAASVLMIGAVSLAGPATSPASSGPHNGDHGSSHPTTFVVNTQFWDDPSPVVSATGPLAGCVSATDLAEDAVEIGPDRLLFVGRKRLTCKRGIVVLSYEARINFAVSNDTTGSWEIVYSTVPGVRHGGGPLRGFADRCTALGGRDDCILDKFSGRVSR